MKTLAVIPAFNEQPTVADVVKGVHAAGLPALVVDDGSTDDTSAVARQAGALAIRLPTNIGVGGALRTGFSYAVDRGFQRVVHIDADLQHDPDAIPQLLDAADSSGASLVIGSRFGTGGYEVSSTRRLAMRATSWFISRTVGVRLDDATSGYRVITEPLLSVFAEDYPAEYLGDTLEAVVLAHHRGAVIAQCPVSMSARTAGRPTPRLHGFGHLLRALLAILVGSGRSRTGSS